MPIKYKNKITVWPRDMQNSRCALTRRSAVQNMCSIWLLLLVTFILCNFYATLTLCMTLWASYSWFHDCVRVMNFLLLLLVIINCTLHCSNYVRSTFKAGQGEWPLLSSHTWYVANFELVVPSREVVKVDWFSVCWFKCWLVSYSCHLSAYTTSSSSCKGASGVLHMTGSNSGFCCFRGMTYVALMLCFKLIRFYIDFCCFKH